jgi:hypothetical protein
MLLLTKTRSMSSTQRNFCKEHRKNHPNKMNLAVSSKPVYNGFSNNLTTILTEENLLMRSWCSLTKLESLMKTPSSSSQNNGQADIKWNFIRLKERPHILNLMRDIRTILRISIQLLRMS